jgi:RND family efflux transporter MFP subunit
MRSLILIPIALMAAGCNRREPVKAAAATAAPVSVAAAPVAAQDFEVTVAVTGTLVSRSRVEVKAETIGRVLRFPKEEGEFVRAGEPVVWIDEQNYQLAVKQAGTAVQVADAALEKARVMESHAMSELERARNLLSSGGITDKDLKAAMVAEQDARAQVALASAQLEQARAALDVTRKRLADAVICAPVSGEILKKHVNAGAYVEAPTPVFTLVDNGRLELESFVPSSELASVRPGQRVTFSVNSHPGRTFEGRVVDLSPAVETDSRAAKVRISVTGAAGSLKAGMVAEGEIVTGVQTRAIVIPSSAIYRDDRSAKDSFVYIADNGKAARRAIRIARERDSAVQIASGLNPGDLLITDQSIELAPGVPVQVKR